MNELLLIDEQAARHMAALPRVVIWGALTGVLSMVIYMSISPQHKMREVKAQQQQARSALLSHSGDWETLKELIMRDLGLSLKQLALIFIPFVLSVAPVIYVLTVLPEAYPEPLNNIGPDWMHGFDFYYLLSLLVVSLVIKIKFDVI